MNQPLSPSRPVRIAGINVSRKIVSFPIRYGFLLTFVLVIGVLVAVAPGFLSPMNLAGNVLAEASILVTISLGMTAVMLGGGVDLSVGAVAGISGMTMALLVSKAGWGILAASLVGIACGTVAGVISGVLVGYVGISPFIATLAAIFWIRGSQYVIAATGGMQGAGTSIYLSNLTGYLQQVVLGLPTSAWIVLITVGLAHLSLEKTQSGRQLRFVGMNIFAALYSGLSVRRLTMYSYVVSGVLSSLAGVLLVIRQGYVMMGTGESYLLNAFAVPIIGMAAFGQLSVFGTTLAAFFVVFIVNGLSILGMDISFMNVLTGVLLFISVVLAGIRRRIQGD